MINYQLDHNHQAFNYLFCISAKLFSHECLKHWHALPKLRFVLLEQCYVVWARMACTLSMLLPQRVHVTCHVNKVDGLSGLPQVVDALNAHLIKFISSLSRCLFGVSCSITSFTLACIIWGCVLWSHIWVNQLVDLALLVLLITLLLNDVLQTESVQAFLYTDWCPWWSSFSCQERRVISQIDWFKRLLRQRESI